MSVSQAQPLHLGKVGHRYAVAVKNDPNPKSSVGCSTAGDYLSGFTFAELINKLTRLCKNTTL